MANPQTGIFTEGHRCHHILEYTVSEADTDAVRAALRSALDRVEDTGVEVVVAFGSALWGRLARSPMPEGLVPFTPIQGPTASAPATQADILMWLHGGARDDVMDAVMGADGALASVATRGLDLPGFTYHDSRDLTGFVDGSANPKDDARLTAALVADGKAGAGGAFVLGQKWVHDLDAFTVLPVAEQERVFGRTKADSIEFEGDAMAPDSHVARTDLKVDGVAMKMYRRSVPYGTARQKGLYFLAFTCEIRRFQVVLDSMFGLADDGVSDRLTQFSRAVTGSYAFAPSETELKAALA